MTSNISVIYKDTIARAELSGHLDAASAPKLLAELEKLIGHPVSRLIFFANQLEYISSAGLRAIIFGKQKIGKEAQVYFIGANEMVLDVIKMSGLDTFLIIQDRYEE